MIDQGEAFIRDAAIKRGIDPDTAVTVAEMEGGKEAPGLVGKFNTGWSFWQYQLHYAMAGKPGVTSPTAGMGEGFTALTGWQPGDPRAWRDAARYALNRAKKGGWGPWYGAAKAGIVGFDGIDRDHPWDATSERWDFETGAEPMPPATLTYNPDQPPERQVQSWACSIRATAWMLKSLGLPVDIGALQGEMSPRYVTPAVGLLDARGYGLAEVLKAHLPAEWHARVHVFPSISWDELRSLAGQGPVAAGFRGAYHWLNVAKPLPDGSLSAPNPAPNWPPDGPIGDVLTRAEFDRWGPASAVWVNAATGTAPPTPKPPTDRETIDGLRTAVAHLCDVVVSKAAEGARMREEALDETKRIREQYVGPKP